MYKLKIGGHSFNIVRVKLKDGDFAETDFDTGEIRISPTLIRSQKESSLIHEVLHVLNPTADASEDGHRILESLSEQLYQVLSDNGMLITDHILGRDD